DRRRRRLPGRGGGGLGRRGIGGAGRRPRVGGRARRAPNRGGADAGRRYLPARAPVDAVLDLWVRGRRARRPRERGGVRTVPLPGGGADRAAVLSGGRPQPQRAG